MSTLSRRWTRRLWNEARHARDPDPPVRAAVTCDVRRRVRVRQGTPGVRHSPKRPRSPVSGKTPAAAQTRPSFGRGAAIRFCEQRGKRFPSDRSLYAHCRIFISSSASSNCLILLAHPTGFEPVTSAFGGITTSSVDYRKGHAMMRYVTVNKKEFDFLRRQAYPSVRHGFRPAAYVVLTRVFGHVTEEVHG